MLPEPGKTRIHNSEAARQAILDAAEVVFAEHGFDGGRIDVIARTSGYNQSLIFRYFEDKLGLYAAVLKRIDRQGSELQASLLKPLLENETILSDPQRFSTFLKTAIGALFDFMVVNPRVIRMILWEHAEGWKTYIKLSSLFAIDDLKQIEKLLSTRQKTSTIQAGSDLFVLLILAEQICWSFLTSLPFYQMILPDRDFASEKTLESLKEQVIKFIVAGLLTYIQDKYIE